jgi:hypothetical protein
MHCQLCGSLLDTWCCVNPKNQTMRDYLKISGDYVEKIYQFGLRSLNEDGLVAKNSLDNEIRLAREQLKIKEDVPESKVADWKFIKEILAKR